MAFNPEIKPAEQEGSPADKRSRKNVKRGPAGPVLTPKEAEQEKIRRADDPNWFREQK